MIDTASLKDYFKKLQKTINYNYDFNLFGMKLIKKHKIDDLLCCILAGFPNSYKQLMKRKEGKNRNSILCYDLMFKAIKMKFIFDSSVYLVDADKATKMINTILATIEKDIEFAEKNAV